MANKTHITDTEWVLVTCFLGMIDLTSFLLDFVGIGEFVNPFIDVSVGMAYPLYLHLRGQNVTSNKRLAGLITTFITDLFSDGLLNFWFVDSLYNWSLAKAEEKLEQAEQVVVGKQLGARIPNQIPNKQ